jgi:hypothetical protein
VKQKNILKFDNPEQLMLFEFLVKDLDIKDIQVMIPMDVVEAKEVFQALKEDFKSNIIQIKHFL